MAAALRADGDLAVFIVLAAALFSPDELAVVSDLAARVLRFGAAAVAAAAVFFEAVAFVPPSLFAAAVLRGVAVFLADDARVDVFVSADFASLGLAFLAAVRRGLGAGSSAAAAAVLRDVRRGLVSEVPLPADLVDARTAMACARGLAWVSSVIALFLLSPLRAI
ncbi:MAG TPA: hypothetical protein VE650_12420 [Acetobacteraceae bacterium]|nr:hypothetical protein [Acetobacteraceae bacterium]